MRKPRNNKKSRKAKKKKRKNLSKKRNLNISNNMNNLNVIFSVVSEQEKHIIFSIKDIFSKLKVDNEFYKIEFKYTESKNIIKIYFEYRFQKKKIKLILSDEDIVIKTIKGNSYGVSYQIGSLTSTESKILFTNMLRGEIARLMKGMNSEFQAISFLENLIKGTGYYLLIDRDLDNLGIDFLLSFRNPNLCNVNTGIGIQLKSSINYIPKQGKIVIYDTQSKNPYYKLAKEIITIFLIREEKMKCLDQDMNLVPAESYILSLMDELKADLTSA